MKISREDVIRVAELAHLGLSPDEVETYRNQLDSILTYIDKLKELDITNVEPMAQVIYTGAKSAPAKAIPSFAKTCCVPAMSLVLCSRERPKPQKPFFRVPKVIEDERRHFLDDRRRARGACCEKDFRARAG